MVYGVYVCGEKSILKLFNVTKYAKNECMWVHKHLSHPGCWEKTVRTDPPDQALLDLAGSQRWRNDCCSCSRPPSAQVQALTQILLHRDQQTLSSYLKDKPWQMIYYTRVMCGTMAIYTYYFCNMYTVKPKGACSILALHSNNIVAKH